MALTIAQTEKLRDDLYKLDPDHNPDDFEKYKEIRFEYLVGKEKIMLRAYDDKGKGGAVLQKIYHRSFLWMRVKMLDETLRRRSCG